MYLLPASDRYISIALYMPALGGILLGMLLSSVSLWIETFAADVQTNEMSHKMDKDTRKIENTRPVSLTGFIYVTIILTGAKKS